MAYKADGFNELVKKYQNFEQQFDKFLQTFLITLAEITIRQTKKLTPVDTGNLRSRWEYTKIKRKGDMLYIEIFNPVEYASHVEDGHGQDRRFVPGEWRGDRFEYIPGHHKGMMLTYRWVKGHHMLRISITKVRQAIPKNYKTQFKKFIKSLEEL